MLPIPELTKFDVVWNKDDHLPAWDDIPEEFKRSNNPYCRFVSQWFFAGRKPEDMARLVPKEGVDRAKALAAVYAALGSFKPKHQHKEAGCAYLLSQWFDLTTDGACEP